MTKVYWNGWTASLRVAICLVIAVFSANGVLAQQAPVRIGVIPYEAASAIETQYAPFAAYLTSKLHRSTTIIVAQDYIGVIQALQSDQIEAAYLNPLSYVLFADKMRNMPEHLIPLSMPWVHGSLYYYGVIFTTTDSGINKITDLKGKNMAFVEPTSTSGYLYPYQYLKEHGVDPDHDFANKYFASANGVVPAVLNGSANAGAIFEEGLQLSTKGRPGDFKRLKILARVGPIANGMLVARGNLDPREVAQLKQALIDINTDPSGRNALAQLQVTKWQPADDSVFDPVRLAARAIGLNIQSLSQKK
jgi:phosphonate transport system substrate-binding protein